MCRGRNPLFLTFQSLLVTWFTTRFNSKKCTFYTHRMAMFLICFLQQTDYFSIQQELIGFVFTARYGLNL